VISLAAVADADTLLTPVTDTIGQGHPNPWSDPSSCRQISLNHIQVLPAAGTESLQHTHTHMG